ncbi:hypothetical protein GCM10011506_25220 [Marivirga lumbricoides]|uniref:Uncharacterized protein n=1 Tax=Marivirga lumbricoides TaxID=1046115 RepID=A0ABQ1MD72_9BACT|nr:hypothetical protein GCM10011506_25220 [Marivirga lumbricoides]
MARTNKESMMNIVVEAKKETKENPARIVVKGKRGYKSIPVVYFTEKETSSLLEIVDRVEKDTNANIVYKK